MKIDNKLILENSKNLNILYVEDDDELRRTSAKLFSNFFKSVELAVDGRDGFEKYNSYLEKTSRPYDIVISDINMPNMNGIEMSQKIKEIHFEQAIIFVTAFNEIEYLHKAIDIGVNAFVTKPIEMEQLKKVLYTTSQVVSDRKLVESYYEQIENANILTCNLQDASDFSSAKDILEDLENNKEKISHLWADTKVVYERLSNHTIDVEYFRKHYAIKVIEYFLNVIKGEAEVGNCPVIFKMLEFFENKNLPLKDIFMICVLFKNSVSAYVFNKYSFNKKLFEDISIILDKNFEGVIINYLKLKNCDGKEIIKSAVKEVEAKRVKKELKKPKEEAKIEEINYVEYVLENDVYELQDLEEEIDGLAISVTGSNTTVEDSTELGNKIKRYGTILSNYPLFSELGKYITKLGINFIDNSQLLLDDKARMLNITALVEGFVNDLIVWRKEIFENNIENPHFLDSSFFSNVDTIIMFIEYDESAVDDESFDDDMFF